MMMIFLKLGGRYFSNLPPFFRVLKICLYKPDLIIGIPPFYLIEFSMSFIFEPFESFMANKYATDSAFILANDLEIPFPNNSVLCGTPFKET
jgi:hypothetical protein